MITEVYSIIIVLIIKLVRIRIFRKVSVDKFKGRDLLYVEKLES